MNRNSIREMSVQDSSDKTTLDNPSFHPWTPHWKIPVDWTVSIRRSGHRPASILFFIYTTPLPLPKNPMKGSWNVVETLKWSFCGHNSGLIVLNVRTATFQLVSLRWPLAFTSPRPLSATINSLMQILFATDRQYCMEGEKRRENCRLCGSRNRYRTNRHVEISPETRGSCFSFLGVNNSISL